MVRSLAGLQQTCPGRKNSETVRWLLVDWNWACRDSSRGNHTRCTSPSGKKNGYITIHIISSNLIVGFCWKSASKSFSPDTGQTSAVFAFRSGFRMVPWNVSQAWRGFACSKTWKQFIRSQLTPVCMLNGTIGIYTHNSAFTQRAERSAVTRQKSIAKSCYLAVEFTLRET